MTRYARAGKGSHQRVAKDPTPWDDMKPSKPQRVRGNDNGEEKKFSGKNRKKERFSKGKGNNFSKSKIEEKKSNEVNTDDKTSSTSVGADHDQNNEQRNFKKSKNANIRGFGQSKSVKILGQFWVPLEDGKRLKGLLRKLKAQGLPRKEILEKLKNERRKAEKASKRQRDKTCFQCRQFGHVLSDCPNLRKASVGDNNLSMGDDEEPCEEQGLVCFKCGSTEHTSRNCRRKGENFEFAKCFVCSGSGHIARQCPKNSNGIYPSGGSCSECGSTTHLKKDCPDFVGEENNHSAADKDEQDVITLRMSDPFSSTEYEPVYSHEGEENAKDLSDEQNTSSTLADSKSIPIKQKAVKRKGKKKSKIDDNAPPTFDFDSGNSPTAEKKPLFANKKRKIVKF